MSASNAPVAAFSPSPSRHSVLWDEPIHYIVEHRLAPGGSRIHADCPDSSIEGHSAPPA